MRTKRGPKIPLLCWRRGRDSNPRVLSHKLISSQPRYDHFDTSAYEIVLQCRSAHNGAAPFMSATVAWSSAVASPARLATLPALGGFARTKQYLTVLSFATTSIPLRMKLCCRESIAPISPQITIALPIWQRNYYITQKGYLQVLFALF